MDVTKEVVRDYYFYPNGRKDYYPMIIDDDDYNCICFVDNDENVIHSIIDEHTYYAYTDAYDQFMEISRKIPHAKENLRILLFRHGDDAGYAVTIEDVVLANRIGYGIFLKVNNVE